MRDHGTNSCRGKGEITDDDGVERISSETLLRVYLQISRRIESTTGRPNALEPACAGSAGRAPRRCASRRVRNGDIGGNRAPTYGSRDLFRATAKKFQGVERRKPLILAACSGCSMCSIFIVL